MRPRNEAQRLRRLRGLLTSLFTAVSFAGLIVVAAIAIDGDAEQVELRLDGELTEVTSSVLRLLSFDDATLLYADLTADELNTMCPQFAVLPGAFSGFDPHFSTRTCVTVDRAMLAGYTDDAVRSGRVQLGYVDDTEGEWVRMRAVPFRDESGQYVGAVVAVTDAGPALTAHRWFMAWMIGGCLVLAAAGALAGYVLSDRIVRPAARSLEKQELLLAETAHDLRTPVAALRALAETALHEPTDRADLLPRTVRLAARMGGIIDGLLVRARLAAGVEQLAIQPVWLDQLVGVVVDETPTTGASVTVTAARSMVHADPSLVQRAVANLLDNAVRYGRKPNEPAVVHITVAGGRVTVADHGPGVDDSIADGLTDRFRTSGDSTGLGLSIVRWVAEAHGGGLRVYNADDGGAIFELSLPERGAA